MIKYGELRERIQLEDSGNSSNATITFTSIEDGEMAFEKETEITIGKYKISLRPHASELALFASGIKNNVTEEEIRTVFGTYGKIISCKLAPAKSKVSQSVTINYSN